MKYVTALAALLAATTAHASTLREYIDSRLPDINAYVRVVTGYKATTLPKVVIKTPAEINKMFFGANYKHQDEQCDNFCIKAIAQSGVIFIGTDFVPKRDDYLLAHELTHYQQFEAGKIDDCPASLEPEAYHVQDKFVEDTGRGAKSDPFTVLVIASSCNVQ